MGIVVRSGGCPNIYLFDRSLHDKVECLESKYMYTFSKYIVIYQWEFQQDLILSRSKVARNHSIHIYYGITLGKLDANMKISNTITYTKKHGNLICLLGW